MIVTYPRALQVVVIAVVGPLLAACAQPATTAQTAAQPTTIPATAVPTTTVLPTAAPSPVPTALPAPAAMLSPTAQSPISNLQSLPVEERIRRFETGFLDGKGGKVTILDRMKQLKAPGVSIAVINNGEIEWARAWGVKEDGQAEPVTPDTLFQAASISKPVAAFALMRLVQEGRLNLDEDVNRRLKTWQVPENDLTKEQKVTLRRILSHTAGLSVSGFRGYDQGQPLPTVPQMLDGLPPANSAPVRVTLLPGKQYRYSGGGYVLLQQLVQDVTDQDFERFMRETVLQPLGMTRSTYVIPLPAELAPQAASGHRANGAVVPGKWVNHPELGPASLWTTPTDLARFAIEVQKSKAGQSNKVLDQASINAMLTTQVVDPDAGPWGLGFQLGGEGRAARFSHGGGNIGYRCRLLALAETGQGVIIMTNSDNGGELNHEVIANLARLYGWPGFGQSLP